jgi:hypothetical protein
MIRVYPLAAPLSAREKSQAVVERRQAVVSRLLALRASGRLQSGVVRAAAESLGVCERSAWRWVAAGAYDPSWRIGWRTTPEAIEAFYRAGGRPTAAWRLCRTSVE